MNISILLIAIFSYMIGSISGGVVVGRLKNVDIRTKGSKAAGATNAFRTMGVENLGIKSFEKIFLHHGYKKKDYYFFKEKNKKKPPVRRTGGLMKF